MQRSPLLRAGAAVVLALVVAGTAAAWDATTSLDTNPIEAVRAGVDTAKRSVDLVVYKFDEKGVRKALERAMDRGVRVRIIANEEEADRKGSQVERLADHGADVRLRRKRTLHAKFMLVDGTRALTGSANLTESAQHDNLELILQTREPREMHPLEVIFDDLWRRASAYSDD